MLSGLTPTSRASVPTVQRSSDIAHPPASILHPGIVPRSRHSVRPTPGKLAPCAWNDSRPYHRPRGASNNAIPPEVSMRSIGLLVLMAASLAATPAVAQVKFTGRTLLKSSTAMDGSPVAYPKTDSAEVTAMLMEIAPGGETGWHMHTAPTFVYVLEGAVEVEERPSGMKHTHAAGEAFLHALNTWHNGRNRGRTPARILVVSTGERGRPVMVHEAAGH